MKENLLADWVLHEAATWFCRPFNGIERIGRLAYRLSLPLIVKAHDVFHESLLQKYVKDVDHLIG